jgi:3D (Asp-Asp-Asp) domain-containing protein/cell division protein FtsB
MSGFQSNNSIETQRNPKYIKLIKGKPQISIWVTVAMFLIIILLCGNHYKLLTSYNMVKDELSSLNIALDEEKIENAKLIDNENDMRVSLNQISKEIVLLKESHEKLSKADDFSKQIEKLEEENGELAARVKELTNDNIALQNSLKMAASAGVKPQNYSIFEGLEHRNTINRGEYIGQFLGTAYTPSKEECGNNKGITKSGAPIIPGVSLAIDENYWPFGTVFYIEGLGYTVAMDTGGAVKGKYRFDFSVLDRNFAMQLGSRKWDVYLVKMGDGKVKDIEL